MLTDLFNESYIAELEETEQLECCNSECTIPKAANPTNRTTNVANPAKERNYTATRMIVVLVSGDSTSLLFSSPSPIVKTNNLRSCCATPSTSSAAPRSVVFLRNRIICCLTGIEGTKRHRMREEFSVVQYTRTGPYGRSQLPPSTATHRDASATFLRRQKHGG